MLSLSASPSTVSDAERAGGVREFQKQPRAQGSALLHSGIVLRTPGLCILSLELEERRTRARDGPRTGRVAGSWLLAAVPSSIASSGSAAECAACVLG